MCVVYFEPPSKFAKYPRKFSFFTTSQELELNVHDFLGQIYFPRLFGPGNQAKNSKLFRRYGNPEDYSQCK